MPYLGDFLGHILAEITIARMHADLEAMRVADLYASHPLLRNMPVPRFRTPEIDMDIPVVVDKMEETGPEEPPRGGIDEEKIFDAFIKAIPPLLIKFRIRTSLAERKHLRFVIRRRIDELGVQTKKFGDLASIINALVKTVTDLLTRWMKSKKIDRQTILDFSDELRDRARTELLPFQGVPPRLHVLVTTREIKEAGPEEIIGKLKIKISEEHLEWSIIERDDESYERLIPE